MKKLILTLSFIFIANVAFGQDIMFDPKTKANLDKINTELQTLQNQANLIIQTVANMNGLNEYEVKKDLSGLTVPEEKEKEKK